jgi:hypothetical protein
MLLILIFNFIISNITGVFFKVWISMSELPASSQANLKWFDWTKQNIKIRAGEEVSIPIKWMFQGELQLDASFSGRMKNRKLPGLMDLTQDTWQ